MARNNKGRTEHSRPLIYLVTFETRGDQFEEVLFLALREPRFLLCFRLHLKTQLLL